MKNVFKFLTVALIALFTLSFTACDSDGYKHIHVYGMVWYKDAAQHWHQCSCGDKSEVADHEWQWVLTTPATEAAEGLETQHCGVCEAAGSTRPIPPVIHVHQWGEWQQTKAPTETEEGEETRTCTLNPAHKDTRPLATLNHEHQWGEWQQTTAPTCTAAGEDTRVCALNAEHKENRTSAALGHSWGAWTQTTAPTCTEAGEDTRVCTNDAAHKETRTGTAALGHNWSAWTQTRAPTCTEAGEDTRVCANDVAHKETREIAINPQAHNWGAWTQTKAPSETEEGEETRTCTHNAAHKETRAIAKLVAPPPFNSVSALQTWLSSQPINTPDTPRTIKLNVNDISTLKATLDANPNKYIKLDLSGSSLTTIPERAFQFCNSLTSVILPNSVTSIGNEGFYSCTRLTSVNIPNNVTSIGYNAFSFCTSLASITIPDSVTVIYGGTFASCTSLPAINVNPSNSGLTSDNGVLYNKDKTTLITYAPGKTGTSFTIPNSVTRIEGNSFFGSINLRSVIIPNSVTLLGGYVFQNCTNLNSVTIPASVTTYAWSNFVACTSLSAINVDAGNSAFSSQDGVMYNKDKTTLVEYPAGKTGTSFTIPNSVTSIGIQGFYGLDKLSSVTIPNSVTSIGAGGFSSNSLVSVTFQGTIPSSGFSADWVFIGDLRDKFYATNPTNGTPGTYTRANSNWTSTVWTKQ